MIFRVGQRVRVTGSDLPEHQIHVGAETVITSERFERFGVWGYKTALSDALSHCIGIPEQFLAPLTDPKESAWAADAVRKVTKPDHIVPLRVEELEHIRGGA